MGARKDKVILSILAGIVLCMCGGGVSVAQDAPSPFMAPRAKEVPVEDSKPVANPLDHMEFDGYMSMNGKTLISIYNRKDRRSYWVEVNTKNAEGFEIASFEPRSSGGEDIIVLKFGGNTKRIQLKNSDILTLAPVSGPPASATTSVTRQTPTRTNGKAIDKESDEEVRERMKRVAEEIRRRRAMRRSLIDGKNGDNAAN